MQQPIEDGLHLCSQIWKRLVTCLIGNTFFDDALKSSLRTLRKIVGHEMICRRYTLKNNGANMIWVLAEIDHRGPRAIGTANQVDALVAESSPDIIKIVHRNRRCIERQVSVTFQ